MTSPWLADLVVQLWDSELHVLMCLFVGKRFSIAAALRKNGYIVFSAMNKIYTISFISLQIPEMKPYPQEQSVLIIDNCRIHHNDALMELVNGAGEQR
jgi:hypothetical protein